MNQEWFEMHKIRRRRFADRVWIPLRSVHEIERNGEYGYMGFRKEFFGVGSVALPKDKKEISEKLGWDNLGISYCHVPSFRSGVYVPCDIYEERSLELRGISLVLDQRTSSDEIPEWHLHQDLVISLGLMREDDFWLCPSEGYIEVVRLTRSLNSEPCLIEIRSEFLGDYLCARQMALYITSYRNREEVVEGASFIDWENGKKIEELEKGQWEGRILPIHEGGMPYGRKLGLLHVSRTDVDDEEDVPTLGLPIDESVSTESSKIEFSGKKLCVIEGELWLNEWIDPAEHSPRVRGDRLPANVFFITDTAGRKESGDKLIYGRCWLWFKPDVIMALINRRGGSLKWYTKDTGDVRCAPDDGIHFGVNRIGLVNVYAKDIGLLPEWQQQIWVGFNVSPDGGVSEELLASQARARPAQTQAPEAFLNNVFSLLNEIGLQLIGEPIFSKHDKHEDIVRRAHRFRAIDKEGLYALAKDMARLTADSINKQALKKVLQPPKKENWESLKLLEKLLATKISSEKANAVMSPLFGIYELRLADAHLPSSKLHESMAKVGVIPESVLVNQGYQLLDSCVSTLYNIAEILKK
jgi:hypothetical protein